MEIEGLYACKIDAGRTEKMNVEMTRAQNISKDTYENRFLLTTAPQFFRLMETFFFSETFYHKE